MKPLIEKIINFDAKDFHMHTSSFSDGLNTIDELVQFAWRIGMDEICITDHSDAAIMWKFQSKGIFASAGRWSTPSYKNVFNSVKVSFGVEWDILNDMWETCFTIQWQESDFIILSAHSDIYESSPDTVTQATIKAIEHHADIIKFIAHPTCNNQFWKEYDLKHLIEVANYHNIPLEINGKSISRWKSDRDKVEFLLKHADALYLNSDAHNLNDLQTYRPETVKLLMNWWYIWESDYKKFLSYFSFI